MKSNRKWLAEFMGTFALVFFGCGAAAMDAQMGGLGGVGVALVFGLIIMAMIYAVGHISGAHFNPAVTFGFLYTKKMDPRDAVPFIIAQCAAACLAAWLLKIGFGDSLSAATTQISIQIPLGQAFALEAIITFFLMFVISAVATDSRAAQKLSGVAIGGTVALASMFAGPLTGASMNPARSLGPALMTGELQALWLYFAAPVLGAALGAKAYQFVGGKPAQTRGGMHTIRPALTLLLVSGLLSACTSPIAEADTALPPLAVTASLSISLNDQEVSTPTLVINQGEAGRLAIEEQNGSRLVVEIEPNGSAHVEYRPTPGGHQHNLLVQPNTQATIQLDQGELKVDYQRQSTGEQQFEKMKSLVGKWQTAGNEESGPSKVIYSLTADGTAVKEQLIPGEAHEMVTMYFMDNGRLTLTHFCALGNQPSMVAVPGDPDEIHFKFRSATNLKSPEDNYMHDLVYTFHSQNRIDADWGSLVDGKTEHRMLFPFVRNKR